MSHHRRPTPIVLLSLLCLFLVAAREVPSAAEIRQLVDDEQYKRALREIARAMQLKGDEAAAYDRGELLLLRADAQLGMRIEPSAAKSFRDVAETATHPDHRATARAMGLLMSRCEQLTYKPRTGEPVGREIDIVKDRKAALGALLADELAIVEPRVRAAREKKQIPDVLEAARAVESVAALERAATGATKRTDELMSGVVTQMETLLDDALIDLDGKAQRIELNALGLIVIPQPAQPGQEPAKTVKARKRGLSPGDEAALKGIMETCREIVTRSREVAVELGAEPDRFRRASDFAIRLASRAGAILRADYSGVQEMPIDTAPPTPASREEQFPPPAGQE